MCVWVLISSQARGGFSSSWTTMRLIMQLYAPNGAFGDCLFVFVRSFVPPFSLPWFCLSVFGLLRADESRKREQSFNLVHFWGQDWAKSGNKQTKEHTKSVLSRSDFLTRAWYSLILVLRSHAREQERERELDQLILPSLVCLWNVCFGRTSYRTRLEIDVSRSKSYSLPVQLASNITPRPLPVPSAN